MQFVSVATQLADQKAIGRNVTLVVRVAALAAVHRCADTTVGVTGEDEAKLRSRPVSIDAW